MIVWALHPLSCCRSTQSHRPGGSVKPVTAHHAFLQREKGHKKTTLFRIHQTKIKIAFMTTCSEKKDRG